MGPSDFFYTSYFHPLCGPGVDSAVNRNQYQESSWGRRGGGVERRPVCRADKVATFMYQLSKNPRSLNLLQPSGRM